MPHTDNILSQRRLGAIVQRERVAKNRREAAAGEAKAREVAGEEPVDTGTVRTFPGRSPLSPLEILLQRDRTSGPRGLLGETAEAGKAVGRAGFEVISEAADTLLAIGNLAEDIPGREGIGKVLRAVSSFDDLGEGSAINRLLGFGEKADLDKDDEEGLPAPDLTRHEAATKERQLVKDKTILEEVDRAAAEGRLASMDQFAADELRESIEFELARIEVELLEMQNMLAIQDRIFEIQAEDAGLADTLDLDPLSDALARDGGLGSQTFGAIRDIAENAALNAQERDEAVDLVMARQHFSEEIIKTVNDIVLIKNNQEKLLALPDIELLRDAGVFLNPTVAFDVHGEDDSERFINDMFNDADTFLEEHVPATIPPGHESYGLFDQTMNEVMLGDVANANVQDAIQQLSEVWDINEADLEDVFSHARETAMSNKIAWDETLEADSARPFTGGLVAAIYQAGEAMGFDPELLEMAAKSTGLHHVIDLMSKGRSGIPTEGTIAGMGGLTQDAYVEYMGAEWDPSKGMQWELQALLEYIKREFNGDAFAAVNFYIDTGEWGGTERMPGG